MEAGPGAEFFVISSLRLLRADRHVAGQVAAIVGLEHRFQGSHRSARKYLLLSDLRFQAFLV
jgi:hypothetical protein